MMHEKSTDCFATLTLQPKLAPQRKERGREEEERGALWDIFHRPAVVFIDQKIEQKNSHVREFLVQMFFE